MTFDSNGKKIKRISSRKSNSKPKSLFLRSIELLEDLSRIPHWRQDYYDPVSVRLETDTTHDYTKLLHYLFKQGSMLCGLVNMVSKNTIPKSEIHYLDMDSKDPFESKICKENIQKFLTACTEYLFISSDDVFRLQDLYKDTTQGFVRAIGLTELLLRRINSMNVDKLSIIEPTLSIKPYILLQGSNTSLSTNTSEHEHGSKTSSETKSPYDLAIISDQNELRDLVIKEILETERSYVNDLELLQVYSNEIDYDKNKQFATIVLVEIFGNINQLVDFQRRFLLEMERILFNSMDIHGLVDLFNRRTNDDKPFLVYHTYCSNFPTARQAVVEYKDKLKKYDDIIPVDLLPSYIIKPIQRICRYPLLLRELVKHTYNADPDHDLLVKVHKQVKLAADGVNETFRQSENSYLAEDMRKRVDDWKGLQFEQFGKLVLMDKLVVVIKGIEKETVVYLYDNYILFCKESSQINLTKRRSKSISIRSYIEVSAFMNVMNDPCPRTGPSLSVSWRDRDALDSFVLKFRNQELMDLWTAAIDTLLSKRNPGYLAALDEHRRKTLIKQNLGSEAGSFVSDSSILEAAYAKRGLPSFESIKSRYHANTSLASLSHKPSKSMLKRSASDSGLPLTPTTDATSGASMISLSDKDDYQIRRRDRQSYINDTSLGLMSPVPEQPTSLNIWELDAQLAHYKQILDSEVDSNHLQLLRYYKEHPEMILTNYRHKGQVTDPLMENVHLAMIWGYITGLERKYTALEEIKKQNALLKPNKIKLYYRDEAWIISIQNNRNVLLDMYNMEQLIFDTWLKYPPLKLMDDSNFKIDDHDFVVYYRDHNDDNIQIRDADDWKNIIEDWNSNEALKLVIKLSKKGG